MRKLFLIFLISVVISGCNNDDNDADDDIATTTPTSILSQPSQLPAVISSPLPPAVLDLPATSVLVIADESQSMLNCTLDQQHLRHEIPQFYFAFMNMLQNPGLKLSIATFNADNYFNNIIEFESSLTNSPDWFSKIEELKISKTEGENYGETLKSGLQSLDKTGFDNQTLLLLTDGSYKDFTSARNSLYSAIDNNIKDNQKIVVVLLCPKAKTVGNLNLWSQLDKDKDSVKVYSAGEENAWFPLLTENILGDYMKVESDFSGWINSNDEKSFTMPPDNKFHVSAISLTKGDIDIEPFSENLGSNLTPNSFYSYQSLAPNSNCLSYQTRLINYTKGDVFYWVTKEKIDVKLSTEIISKSNGIVKLATIMTVSGKSNSDLINLLSCYKPELTLQENSDSGKLRIMPSPAGYCLDGWCAEPSRLVAYWEWSDTIPPLIDSFKILNRLTDEKIYSISGQDVTPAPFIYKAQFSGPYQSDFEPYLQVQLQVWYSNEPIENIAVRVFSDLSRDGLIAIGQTRNNNGDDSPLCPLPINGQDFVAVPSGQLSRNQQVIKSVDPLSLAVPQLSTYLIKIYRATGWHMDNDGDGENMPHCDYDTFHLLWNDSQWECNFPENECHQIYSSQ